MHQHPNEAADKSAGPDAETIEFAQKIFDLVRAGDVARLQPLLAQRLPVNLRNHKGDSLLMLASYHGHIDTARLLLEHGADPELYNDQGQAPLAAAAYKGDAAMVELLLEHGANIDGAMPGGRTALMMAAMFNRCDVLDLLLARGASPEIRDSAGLSAVDVARIMGAPDTPIQLMKAAQREL